MHFNYQVFEYRGKVRMKIVSAGQMFPFHSKTSNKSELFQINRQLLLLAFIEKLKILSKFCELSEREG